MEDVVAEGFHELVSVRREKIPIAGVAVVVLNEDHTRLDASERPAFQDRPLVALGVDVQQIDPPDRVGVQDRAGWEGLDYNLLDSTAFALHGLADALQMPRIIFLGNAAEHFAVAGNFGEADASRFFVHTGLDEGAAAVGFQFFKNLGDRLHADAAPAEFVLEEQAFGMAHVIMRADIDKISIARIRKKPRRRIRPALAESKISGQSYGFQILRRIASMNRTGALL